MTQQEIEAEFLNSDGPEFEEIQDADSFQEAFNIATDFISGLGLPNGIRETDLTAVVNRIRNFEYDL